MLVLLEETSCRLDKTDPGVGTAEYDRNGLPRTDKSSVRVRSAIYTGGDRLFLTLYLGVGV